MPEKRIIAVVGATGAQGGVSQSTEPIPANLRSVARAKQEPYSLERNMRQQPCEVLAYAVLITPCLRESSVLDIR